MQILEEEQRVVVEGFSFILTKTVFLLKDLQGTGIFSTPL